MQRISAAVWIALLAAFVCLGIRSVAPRLDWRTPHLGAPFVGIDTAFEKLLSVRDGTRRILEIAKDIQFGPPVIVAGPGDDTGFCETYFSISYLLWPRRVWELAQVAEGKTARFRLMPEEKLKPAAIFLFRFQKPHDNPANTRQIAPELNAIFIPENNR